MQVGKGIIKIQHTRDIQAKKEDHKGFEFIAPRRQI